MNAHIPEEVFLLSKGGILGYIDPATPIMLPAGESNAREDARYYSSAWRVQRI
jgi:hypothetical protein